MTAGMFPPALWSSLNHFPPLTYCQVEMGPSSQVICSPSHSCQSMGPGEQLPSAAPVTPTLRAPHSLCEFSHFCIVLDKNSSRITAVAVVS